MSYGYPPTKQPTPYPLILIGLVLVLASGFILMGVIVFILLETNRPNQSNPSATATFYPTSTPFEIIPPTIPAIELTTPPMLPTSTEKVEITSHPQEISSAPSATFTLLPPSPLPSSLTPSASYTPTSTFTPSLTPTPTSTPSPTPPPTTAIVPSILPVLPTITPFPVMVSTAIPRGGLLMRLFYDNSSFYIYNTTTSQIAASSLTFESLTDVDLRFNGASWASFYSYLEGGKCMAIEITTGPSWLRPSACRTYNAIVTPQSTARMIFWREGFRVLWNDQEIGRCTANGSCEVYLP